MYTKAPGKFFTLYDLTERLFPNVRVIIYNSFHQQEVFSGVINNFPQDLITHFGNKIVKNIAVTDRGIMIIYID